MTTIYSRVMGLNLLLLLLAVVSFRLLYHYDEISYALAVAMFIVAQLVINLLFAIFHRHSEARTAHFLSLFLLPLIGFGACMAGGAIRL